MDRVLWGGEGGWGLTSRIGLGERGAAGAVTHSDMKTGKSGVCS